MRSGTVDVAAVAGFAAAVEVAVATARPRRQRVGALRDRLIDGVLRAVPDAVVHGPRAGPSGLPGWPMSAFRAAPPTRC